ncbi:MAG: ASPIC/UnbV domain-containing protein, partial [Bacteroidota bacterium]
DIGMGWGNTWLDYDNDGWQDIYMVNDSYFSPLPNVLFRNKGDNTFADVSSSTPLMSYFGGYGVSTSDINGDGKIDVLLANYGSDDRTQLFQNNTSTANHWIKVKTIGTQSNRSGIGARVQIKAGDLLLTDIVTSGSGYAGQNSLTLHFGVGMATEAKEMTVYWPSGLIETFENLAVDQMYIIEEGKGLVTNLASPPTANDFKVLLQPNPASDEFQIQYELEQDQMVQIGIYNLQGQLVQSLFTGQLPVGVQQHDWNLQNWDLSDGLYLLRLDIDQQSIVHKLSVIR